MQQIHIDVVEKEGSYWRIIGMCPESVVESGSLHVTRGRPAIIRCSATDRVIVKGRSLKDACQKLADLTGMRVTVTDEPRGDILIGIYEPKQGRRTTETVTEPATPVAKERVTDCTSTDPRYWTGQRYGSARYALRMARACREAGLPAEAARYLRLASVYRHQLAHVIEAQVPVATPAVDVKPSGYWTIHDSMVAFCKGEAMVMKAACRVSGRHRLDIPDADTAIKLLCEAGWTWRKVLYVNS